MLPQPCGSIGRRAILTCRLAQSALHFRRDELPMIRIRDQALKRLDRNATRYPEQTGRACDRQGPSQRMNPSERKGATWPKS